MADVNANIGIHIDSSAALAELKALQRQIATFHASIAKNSAASAAAQKGLQTNLLNSINATGQFHAQMGLVRTSTESFTHALENNKLSMREYFRYAGASTKSFGKLFRAEFDTIGKVAEERVRKMQTQYIKMGRDASGATKAMSITPTTLNMKDFGNQAAVAGQKQAIFNQLVKQGSTSLLNFGKNTQWAGRQLMVGFSVPLMYIGTIASKTFMEMEEQAIRFKRVYGDIFTSAEETDKAIKEIESLAKSFTKYGIAVTDTMKMAADAAAMGKTGAELTAQVAEATRLAVLGGVEQQQSLETTISLTNAFGIAADQLAGKINFLNAVENQTVVSIEDLTIAIPKAGPVIQQLGGDVEDLAFFLTAMKEGGINASEGANALKSGLAALINPSKKASAMLMDLGVNINGIVEGNVGDLQGTVVGFAKALDTLDPLNRSRAIEQLFGKFQFARLSTLFKNITTDGTQASKVLKLTEASVEELAIMSERELKRVEDAVGVDFKQAVEDLKVSIMPIGKAFLEALTPIIKFAAEILKKFDGLGDGTKKFIVVATTLVGILGPTLLMTFGLVANGAANIIKLFLALRSGFLKLSGNTTVLSQQTSYLNAEQLEAATVAASLNQAHTRLTQSFNLEATAVHALRNAYVQATTAALTFARANPGMMSPGFKGPTSKKFSTGSTYVPGIGTKDTVPSMLTPGEAVIPRDVAQNPAYQPIIDAMVNGKLQGFSKGTTAVVAFGAHQPFTTAHEDIANQGKSLAVAEGSEFIQYTSAGTKAKKGVVSLDTRVRQIEESVGKPPVVATDPFAVMEDLKNRGITEVKVLLGSDRMESTVFDLAAEKHGITLEKVEVPRVPGSEDDVSATKLRKAVEDGDLKAARKLLAKGTSAATKKLIIDEIKEHYKTEKSKVTLFDREYNARTPDGADGLRKLIDKFVPGEKADTYVFTDPKTGEQTTLSREKIIKAFDQKSQPGQKFNASSIQKRLVIGTGYRGSGITSARSGKISDLAKEAGYPNKIQEQEAIEKYLKERGIELTPGQKKSYFQLEQAHLIESVDSDGNKIFRAANIVPELGWSNNYLNTVKGSIGQDLLAMTDDQLKARGTDRASVQRLVDGEHPNTAALAKAMRATAVLDVERNPTKAIAHATIAGMDYRFDTGFYPATGGRPTIAELFPDDATVKAQTKEDKIFAETDKNVKNSRFKDEPVTRYGEKISKTSGFSFEEANHLGGVYKKSDGTQVFVKPMMTEDIALAEQRLTEIGRRVGLDTPEQTLRVIEDSKTGKKLFALESPYNEAFDPATIPRTFSENDYFTQVVAAGVRGDTDLKKGNLGGSVLTDPGRSGVLNKASGPRYLTMDIPSIKEIAEKNLGGVSGPNAARSPQWFGNATVDIAKSMTPDVYHDKMLAELNRQEGIIKQALIDFNLNPLERPYYENMLTRIEEAKGVDWRELHKRHTSIVIKPDEEIENVKTGKTRKPQTESRPANIKSSSGDPGDSKIAPPLKKDEEVVQGSKAKKGKKGQKAPRVKTVRPGFADARISQADALAGLLKPNTSGMKITMPGAGLSDAEFKKQFDALNTEFKNTTGRFKDLGHKANIASGAVAGLTMMAAFSGGKLGEIATAAMPFVFGIQGIVALLPMLANPWVAAVAAIAVLGVSVLMMNKQIEDARKEGIGLANAMSMTSKKLQSLSVITDTVSASEEASKRRDNIVSGTTEAQRTVGQNLLESDFGKNLLGDIDILAKSGLTSDAIAKNVSTGLSQAVLQGVITTEQAASIAAALGQKLGSYEIPAKITGNLVKLLGPDGSNLYENPLEIALKIKADTYTNVKDAFEQALVGANDMAVWNSLPGWKKAIDIAVGATGVGVLPFGETEFKSRNAKLDAAAVQLGAEAIAQNQQLLDGVKQEYDIKIKNAKTEKEVIDLQNQKKAKVDELNIANAETLKQVQTLGSGLGSDDFTKAINASIDVLYKDSSDAVKAFVGQAKDNLSELSDTPFKKTIQLGFASKQLSASTVLKILEYSAENKNLEGVINFTINEQGFADTAVMMDLFAKTGADAKTVEILFNYVNKNKESFDTDIEAVAAIANMEQAYGIKLNLKANGVTQIINATRAIASIKDLPEKLDFKLVQELAGTDPLVFKGVKDNWAELSEGKETINKSLVVNYTIASNDPTFKAEAGTGLTTISKLIGKGYDKPDPTKIIDDNLNDPVIPPPRDTTLDEMLKKLKFVRDASIDAEGSLSYLMKIVSGKGITKFAGVSQQLMAGTKGGFNREFIGMLESMDNKTRDIYMRVKKGKVVLTEQGVALKAAFNEKVVGEYHDAQIRVVQDSVAQDAAFKKLKAAGVDTATALEMTADANLAVAINAKKIDKKKMLEMAAAAKAAKDETLGLDRALISVIDNSQKELDKANEDLNTLSKARTKFNYSAEDLKIIGDSPTLLNTVKKMLDPKTAAPEVDKLKKDIELGLSNIKTTVKVNANISDLKRSIEEIAGSVQSIFDRAMSNMQKIIAATEAGIAIKWDPIIAGADKAVDEIQATIDDKITIDPATGAVTKVEDGLQTIFDKASDKVDAQNKLYDKAVEDIEDAYTTDTAGFVQKIKDLNTEIKKIQDAKDIKMDSKISVAMGFGDSLGGLDTNALSLEGAEKFVADTQVRIQEQFNRPIEMFQQEIASYNRTIEMQYTRAVEKIQKEIEGIQRKISIDFELPLSDMQDESSKLSEDLAVMDKIAESINDKYKVQEDALTKVAELNQDIVEQQKQQLGLADALSKGDISAAAAAVQDIRATQAAKSLGSQQGTLGKAKEAELEAVKSSSGLTRDQIAARQYAIERASYEIQVRRAALEKDIAEKQEKIYNIENSEGRLAYIKAIKDKEDQIYALELSRQTVNNGLYAIQTQIEAKNAAIAVQQAAINTQEDKIQEKQDAREAAIKKAQTDHKNEMIGLNADLKKAEDNLKTAQDALAAAQAKADALRKAKDAEIAAATEAMKAEFAKIEAGLKAAEAAALDFTKQLGLAKTAAKELAALYADAIKKQTDADAAKLAAEKKELEDREKADKKILADRIAAAKAKVTAAEEALANAIENQESSTIISGLRAKLNEARKAYALSPEGMLEANANVITPTPTPTPNPGTIGPKGTYTEGLFLNPQLKGMNPETIAAILKGMGYYNYGGLIPEMFAAGGFSKGTDTVPAMLTPGEFVVRKAAVDKYGMNMLSALNEGYLHKGGPVGHKHKYGASSTPPGGYTTSGQTTGNGRYQHGPGLTRDGNPSGWKEIFKKENWEQTANFFGLPSIGKTIQDLVKYGGPSPVAPLAMTIARLTGQEMKSSVGDNLIAGSSVIPIPIAKLAKPVVNAAAKVIPQGVKKFVEKDLGIDMFTKLSAKLNQPAAAAVASKVVPETPTGKAGIGKLATFKLLKNATHASWSDNLAGKTLDPMGWKSGKADSMGRLNYLGTKETFESAGENVYKLSLLSLIKASSGKGLIKGYDFQKEFGMYPGGVKPDSEIWKAFLDSKYTGVLGDIVNEVGLKMPVRYTPVKLAPKIVPEDMGRIDISEFLDSYTATSKVAAPEVPVIADVPVAKPKLPEGYSLNVDTSDPYLNFINVTKDGEKIGQLSWDKITNVVEGIKVLPPHQGQLIGTEMWNYAKSISPITHSPYRTPAGDKFAHSIGDEVVPLNDGWLPGDWSEGLLNAAKARAAAKSAPISVANAAPTVPPVMAALPAPPVRAALSAPPVKPEVVNVMNPSKASKTILRNLQGKALQFAEADGRALPEMTLGAKGMIDAHAILGSAPTTDLAKAYHYYWEEAYSILAKQGDASVQGMSKEDFLYKVGSFGKGAFAGKNDLATVVPDFMKSANKAYAEAHGLDPNQQLAMFKATQAFSELGGYWSMSSKMATAYGQQGRHLNLAGSNAGTSGFMGSNAGIYRIDVLPEQVPTPLSIGGMFDEFTSFLPPKLVDEIGGATRIAKGGLPLGHGPNRANVAEEIYSIVPGAKLPEGMTLKSLKQLLKTDLHGKGAIHPGQDALFAKLLDMGAIKPKNFTPDGIPTPPPTPLTPEVEALIADGRSWNNKRATELKVTEKENPDYAKLYDLQKEVAEEEFAIRMSGERLTYPHPPKYQALYGSEPTPEKALFDKHSANDSPYWKYKSDRDYYEHELATLNKAEKFGIPPADVLALRNYLEKPLLGHLPNQKAAINSLVEKFIIPEGTTSYRGLSDVDLEALSGLQIGESFVSPTVRSITNDYDAAAKIAAFGGTSGGQTDALAVINFGEGVKGIPDIAAFAESQGLSHEGIIAPNTKFILESFKPAATTASRYENQVGIHQINTVPGEGEIITKDVNEYVLRAVNADAISIPAISPATAIPPVSLPDPKIPKIIESKISASKLKKLTKLIDEDYTPSKSDTHRLMMATGGLVPGLGNKDTISSMLTPGEFVIKKSAVEAYGANNLAKINDGISTDSSVYNYSLSVNVNGNNLNADDIASTVMQKIKYIDGQRIRGQR